MATTDQPLPHAHVWPEIDNDTISDDAESIASNETDDGQFHFPEKILSENTGKDGTVWYLVKWKDCSILRSSWEGYISPELYPQIFADWEAEKQKQLRGESKPVDLAALDRAAEATEEAERRRRTLRRLKRHVRRILSIVDV